MSFLRLVSHLCSFRAKPKHRSIQHPSRNLSHTGRERERERLTGREREGHFLCGLRCKLRTGKGSDRVRVGGKGSSEEEGGSANERSVEWTCVDADEMDVAGRMEVRCLFER